MVVNSSLKFKLSSVLFLAVLSSLLAQNVLKMDTINPPAVKLLPLILEKEYEAGVLPGDGEQYMLDFAVSESDPDRIYMGQDMGGVWVSRDAGKTWNNLKNKGLFTRCIIGLEADPLDKNLIMAAAHARYFDPMLKGYQGIYRSTDGGINWKRVLERKDLGEIRNSTQPLAHAPSSKDDKLGYATRWYAAFGEFSNENGYGVNEEGGTRSDDGFFYSDDAGQTWKEVRTLPTKIFGNKVHGIKVHPKHKEIVFMYGNKGLIRFNDATDPKGDFVRISEANGLPAGIIFGPLYISKDGQTGIIAVADKGIYKSVDGLEHWSILYEYPDIQKCFVNTDYPNVIYATARRTSKQQVRVSHDGGKTWYTNVTSVPRPGYSGNWNTLILGDMGWIIPDSRNPMKAMAHGNAKNHRTENGGKTWFPSSSFFNGSAHFGYTQDQMFDPNDPDRFAYFMIDKGVWYTDNGGKFFRKDEIPIKKFGIKHKTCNGGALHPDGNTGIMLASMDRFSGKLIRSADNGKTWNLVSDGVKDRRYVGFDQQNPDFCYQGREISKDTGKTWKELPMPKGAVITGMSFTDGRILYAIQSTKKTGTVWRSNDRGQHWEKVIDTNWSLMEGYVFRVDPKNHDMVYTNSPSGQLIKWNLSQPKGQQRMDLDLFNGKPLEDNFRITRFAIDRRYPDIMYAVNQRDNTGNKMFRSVNGGKTWQNISDGFPNMRIAGLEVSPVTGEVFFSGGNGSRIMLPPYETEYSVLKQIPYQDTYIDQPYK